jgi:hypothetical protein
LGVKYALNSFYYSNKQACYNNKKTEYLLFEKRIVCSAITSTDRLAGQLTTKSKEMLTSQDAVEWNNLKGIHLRLGNDKKIKGKRGKVKIKQVRGARDKVKDGGEKLKA